MADSKKYDGSQWEHSLRKLTTATETVDTTVQPSEFTATWTGWHDAEVKEKSENLCDESEPPQQIYVTATVTRYGYEVSLPSGTYTVSGGDATTFTKTKVGTTYAIAKDLSVSRTLILEENGYILIYAQTADKFDNIHIMLNTGSTALPYEPYGWLHSLHSLRKLTTATDTITTLPADIYADGTNATVGLKGNMSQTGTPTPSSPIQPSECGERTENLFDASNPNIFNGYYNATTNTLLTTANNAFIYIPLVQGKKYYVYGCKRSNPSTTIRWVTTSAAPYYNIPCIRTGVFAQTDIFTIMAETNEKYLALFLCGDSDYSAYGTVEDAIAANGANLSIDNGYKIPISSANTTTPVYLGEVQTVRQIKKLVLTGEGNWSAGTEFFYRFINNFGEGVPYSSVICTHAQHSTINNTGEALFMKISDFSPISSVADFKSYLAAQYAAGTPVTVWYVLATETTGMVNEPLRKIGDYADTVSGISIPTITGKDTVDVETSLKPSEVELTYTGWHDATVKEWDGSDWK